MDLITILIIAVALALDCFAVALAAGIRGGQKIASATRVAVAFGSFQAGMPLLGWLAGRSVMDLISGFDHWVAFALLAIVGLRMTRQGFIHDSHGSGFSLDTSSLLVLAVATSIDAMAVGVSFALLNTGILIPCLIIGLAAFAISFLGAALGGVALEKWGKTTEVVGGLVLIAIGIQILVTHMPH
jgi:putative Mn2+ efflux pump MntP